MKVRVGFNGFGRLGRNIFRVIYGRDDIEVRAIADVATPESVAYLLNFDSIHGRFTEQVTVASGHLFAGGKGIAIIGGQKVVAPGDVKWRDHDIDIVIEASGRYRTRKELERHIEAGARRVILTVPPRDAIDKVVVFGLNDHTIDKSTKIVSNASCTSNALGIMCKILDEAFGIERAAMTTVHAYTNDARLADVPHEEIRRSRAAAENIIPASTHSVALVQELLPNLRGKIVGQAVNVPVPDGSVIDLTAILGKRVSAAEVNEVFKSAARSTMKNVLEYCEQPIVSSDVIGNQHSAIYDSLITKVLENDMVKTVAWYDNGWGYANRVVDLIGRLAATL
jgi:glyceraldehyde 3-phosphate dehydrogenase